MTTREAPMRPTSAQRRGSVPLVIVLILLGAITTLVVTASDRMFGMQKLSQVDLAKQRSAAAAEAVAAMVESKLMDAAADYTKLLIPVETNPETGEQPWWGLRGCMYKDSAGNLRGPGVDANAKGIWLNGCLVRWMIEPVRVYSKAWNGTPSADSKFIVNPPSDPSTVTAWESAAKKDPDNNDAPGDHSKNISDFYHFRIVAQAYALSDINDTDAQPWNEVGSHVAASQSLRILQVQSLQLFKYALFYAADAPVGDLDLQTGGRIWVQKGAVHSNGAIYIRGGESNGFGRKNWHIMASGDGGVDAPSAGQNIFLGEESYPITITGVAGIFRMGKTANHLAALNHLRFKDGAGATVLFDPNNPRSVPTDRARFVSDDNPPGRSGDNPLDLNGDWNESSRHRFNGVNFTRLNDSRSEAAFQSAFKNYARDANNGGLRVNTLQNIPDLGGRPFEPQSVIYTTSGEPAPLYGSPTGNPLSLISRNKKRNNTALVPLHYAVDPTSQNVAVSRGRNYNQAVAATITASTAGRPIMAEEMKLWWNAAFSTRDVLHPSQEVALRDQIPHYANTACDAGDGAPYTLGSTLLNGKDTDREMPASFAPNATSPNLGTYGLLSFPGVPLELPPVAMMPPGFPADITHWDPGFYGTGFSPREVKGHYLEAALFGELAVSGTLSKQQQYYRMAANDVLVSINKTGLVIRERRWQQRPTVGAMRVVDDNSIGNEETTAWNTYWRKGWLPGSSAWRETIDPPMSGIPDKYLNPSSASSPEIAQLVRPLPRPRLPTNPTMQDKLDYVQYLCSQYVVLFCGRNITAPFFGQILMQENPRDFIVTEDEFVDPRESGYMWGLYGATGDVLGGYTRTATEVTNPPVTSDATDDFYQYQFYKDEQDPTWACAPDTAKVSRDYRQNVLTIHMRAFQLWLRSTSMQKLGYPNAAANDVARNHFTGVVYCHRTRRSDTMHPLLTPELDWPGMKHIDHNVETTPSKLGNQSHFRAYWFTEVAKSWTSPTTNNPFRLPHSENPTGSTKIIYPPINFPWNWREPSGPLETTRCATRLKGQLNDGAEGPETLDPTYYKIFWNHSTPESTTDPLGTSALTYITPQRLYMWGNYCYRMTNTTSEVNGREEIDDNLASITPCAVFADSFTMQSVDWKDFEAALLPHNAGHHWQKAAGTTTYFTSMVINNSPNAAWNCSSFGSAGQEGTFRMIENWGDKHLWWSGSQVVMNMGRYHHSGHNYVSSNRENGRGFAPAHMGVGAFHTGNNHYVFNTNLFKREGRPPMSPSGVAATRVVNQITHFGD